MQTYSTTVVIDSLLKSEEIESTIEKIKRTIKNNGGKILEIDHWGKKRLAYEIKKRQYGYYVEVRFNAMGDVVKVIEREYGLDENILRYLTIKLNKKALDHRQKEKEKSMKKEEVTIKESIDEEINLESESQEENTMEKEAV